MVVFHPADDTKTIRAYPQDPKKLLCIGAGMCPDMEVALTEFLRSNADVFAWKPSDMSGIPCEIVEHCLNIKVDAKLVQQRLHRCGLHQGSATPRLASPSHPSQEEK